jgi:hypothetical protein
MLNIIVAKLLPAPHPFQLPQYTPHNPAESKFKVPIKWCIPEYTHLFWINHASVKSYPHNTTVPPPPQDLPLPSK